MGEDMNEKSKQISIVGIIGSVKTDGMTAKAMAIVADQLKNYPNVDFRVVRPGDLNLTLPGQQPDASVKDLQATVAQATGIVMSTPEYHGSYSSTVKLVIDNLGYPSVLAGKPVALLGVASGAIGAVKALEHLRSVCSHIGSLVLPGPVSVANVHEVFDASGKCRDKKMEKRLRALATNLMDYVQKHVCTKHAFEETVREE